VGVERASRRDDDAKGRFSRNAALAGIRRSDGAVRLHAPFRRRRTGALLQIGREFIFEDPLINGDT
jgi:hypothetical protein